MNTRHKLLLTVLTVAALVGVIAAATFSAYSSTTDSSANDFDAGTVYVDDNDAGAVMYDVTNQKPGVTTTRCIKVNYKGSLDADVRLYTDSTVNSFAQYVNVRIVPVTFAGTPPAFPSCTGSTEEGSALFNGKLGGDAGFATVKNSYANGVSDYPGTTATKWTGGGTESAYYKFELSVDDTNSANAGNATGYSTGSHRFVWEARSQ